jgi:hypothetical protein
VARVERASGGPQHRQNVTHRPIFKVCLQVARIGTGRLSSPAVGTGVCQRDRSANGTSHPTHEPDSMWHLTNLLAHDRRPRMSEARLAHFDCRVWHRVQGTHFTSCAEAASVPHPQLTNDALTVRLTKYSAHNREHVPARSSRLPRMGCVCRSVYSPPTWHVTPLPRITSEIRSSTDSAAVIASNPGHSHGASCAQQPTDIVSTQ